MAISNLLATINAVSFFSGKPDHFLARPLSQTTRRIQTSCCYREPSLKPWTPITMSEVETDTKSDSHRVGIFRFLQGKSYLITGATGFLAKVLIEKLVRASPETGKIFFLMKTEDQESANKRLYDEIISSDLFRLIKQTHGSSYEAFMKSKLIPVVGDIGEDNLGIKSQMACNIRDKIDVIISCAGRTTFDDRYDSALNVNALGPGRLLSFGKGCKKLKLFLHISTAYVTGNEEGTILETPLCIGENITSHLNIETKMKLASEALRKFYGREEIKKLKELGMERAQYYGWENTCTFTKAMGECVIHNQRGDLPVLIIRPSVIESSYTEPFPGWLQGKSWSQLVGSVLDPVGALSVFLGSWFQVVHGFVLSDELSIGSMKLSEGKTKRGREELLRRRFEMVTVKSRRKRRVDGVLSFHASGFLDARA
ncbi:hypothetical protein BRARA_I03901 [Brassica rapa]|uniref:Fatty acyl-CoA reductase n=1 Tax=Brassica campestris TaxID=3711 RepID=A0A397Y0Z8_BRACM|nr:hypothetical protein BRARA_I03901 [Brassica rapa]